MHCAFAVDCGTPDTGAKLVAAGRLAAVEAGGFRSVQAGEALLRARITIDLAADVAVDPAETGLATPDLVAHPTAPSGMPSILSILGCTLRQDCLANRR